MKKKKRKSNKNDEQQPKVVAESEENVPDEAVPEGQQNIEEQGSDDGPQDEAVEAPLEEQELDRDGLLADVRQALVTSDEGEEKRKGIFQKLRSRLKKSSQAKSGEIDDIPVMLTEPPAVEESQLVSEEEKQKTSTRISRQQREEIDSFFSDIEALTTDVDYEMLETYVPEQKEYGTSEEEVEQEIETIEEPVDETIIEPVSVEDDVPQVSTISDISIKPKEVGEKELDLREIALQDYDDSIIEPASEVKLPVTEVVRTTVRDAKPFERFLLGFAIVVTIVIMLSGSVYLISSVIPQPTPTITPVPSDIPYPVRVILPGDWRIDLHKGQVVDGKWDPRGAEWLEGTEISRWVALPWSEQVEAVVRTFKRDDQVGLVMSNYDILTYKVESIEEMNFEGLQSLDNRTPGLLLILPQGENNEEGLFWVVAARP